MTLKSNDTRLKRASPTISRPADRHLVFSGDLHEPAFPGRFGRAMLGVIRGRSSWLVVIPVAVSLLIVVVVPGVFLLLGALGGPGGISLSALEDPGALEGLMLAARNSISVGIGSVILSAAIGIPLAILVAGPDFRGRLALSWIAVVPALMPPLVGVMALALTLGPEGPLFDWVGRVGGVQEPTWAFRGPGAVLVAHGYSMYIYFYLFTAAGILGLGRSVGEGARSLGAGPIRQFREITLPRLWPALLSASILVFVGSLGSFAAPYVLGDGFEFLTTRIYANRVTGALTASFVEAVVLAAIGVGAFVFIGGTEKRRRKLLGGARGRSGRRELSTPNRVARMAISGGLAFILLLPVIIMGLVSLSGDPQSATGLIQIVSVSHFASLGADPEMAGPIWNSLRMSAAAAGFCFLFTIPFAWVRSRHPGPGGGALGAMAILPWPLTGTVVGLALATTLAVVVAPLGGRVAVMAAFWILPVAYFLRCLPVISLAANSKMHSVTPDLRHASISLGETAGRTLRRVTLPMVVPGVAAIALLAFLFTLAELATSIIIYSHRLRPISIELLHRFEIGDFGAAAALGVVITMMLGGGVYFVRRFG